MHREKRIQLFLVNLRFLLLQERTQRQRDRLEVDLFRETQRVSHNWAHMHSCDTPQTVWAISEGERELWNMVWLAFMGWVISWNNEWENHSKYWGKGQGFPGIGPPPSFWPFMVGLKTVLVGAGGCDALMLTYYSKCLTMLKVCWKSTHPPSWT